MSITQNASVRESFSLTAPEMGRLTEVCQVYEMVSSPKATCTGHRELLNAVWSRQEENFLRLKDLLRSSINPMTYEAGDLINITSKVVMPVQVQEDVGNQYEIGQQRYT